MHKKALLLTACLGLALHLQGCTSKDSKQDSEAASEYDSAELENLEGGGETANSDSLSTDTANTTDQLPEDALGDANSTASTDTSSELSTESSTDTSTDTSTASTDPLATGDLATSNPAGDPSTIVETPVDTSNATDILPPPSESSSSSSFADSSTSSSSSSSFNEEKPKPVSAPLQKIAAAPWKVSGGWANTVYFARPGDSLASVSQTIYGSDKTKELKRINPTYSSRDLKPGDKVYYVSPHRADDSSKVITFFEDTGVQPETYVAQKGDNIRKVAKKLLGYDGAWKEVWASNSVESKSSIDEGTELKYWKGSAIAAAPVAPATPPPAAPTQEMPPPPPVEQHSDMAAAVPTQELPPPPPVEQQANMDMPPPPPTEGFQPPPPPPDMAQNSLPPPPPPPADLNPPPPPPPQHMDEPRAHETGSVAGEMDNDTTLALAVVGIAAAGLAALIVMRKKRRQKELEQALNDTQVGT